MSTLNIYHIDKNRFERIKAQGYQLPTLRPVTSYRKGDSEYHLIDGDHAFCNYCRSVFGSLKAETPAELNDEQYRLNAQGSV